MKITIEQAPVEGPVDPFAELPPAEVTVDMDDGKRISFQAVFRAVLDMNPGGLCAYPETDFSPGALARSIREPGAFTVTMEDVRTVSIALTPRETG